MNISDIFTIIGVIATIIGTGIAGLQAFLAFQEKKIPPIKDDRVLRILRALVNEEQGRSLNIYQDNSFYGPVLRDLAEEKNLLLNEGTNIFSLQPVKKQLENT